MTTLKTKTHKEERKERENQIFEEKESLRLSPNNRPTKQFHERKGRKKRSLSFFSSVRRTFLLPQFRELKKKQKTKKKNLNRKFLRSICKLQTMKLIKKNLSNMLYTSSLGQYLVICKLQISATFPTKAVERKTLEFLIRV